MCHAICTVTCSTWQRSMFSVSVPEDVDQFTAVVREDDGRCLGESCNSEWDCIRKQYFFFHASAWQKILKHTAQHLPPLSPLPSRPHLSSVTTITPAASATLWLPVEFTPKNMGFQVLLPCPTQTCVIDDSHASMCNRRYWDFNWAVWILLNLQRNTKRRMPGGKVVSR